MTLLQRVTLPLLVMITVLGPTFNDVGPTAPVDPDWHERRA